MCMDVLGAITVFGVLCVVFSIRELIDHFDSEDLFGELVPSDKHLLERGGIEWDVHYVIGGVNCGQNLVCFIC